MTTLHDIIDLAVEIGPAVEAGPLRLFPLFITAPSAPAYLAGPEAGAAGVIAVEEHGDGAEVPELVLTSGAALPLLLLEGETALGVKQNRTLNVSVLCPPQTPTVIPVSCVEAGRWGAVQPVSHSPRLSPSALRAAKTRSVVNAVRTFLDEVQRAPATETGGVALWTEIHFGDDDVSGGALLWEGAVVHLAAFGAAGAGR